ncbi:unnamed protein product [Ceratitis capitata]|uniref:(Mediterranean fruit fly) hypothetical protein n=1 Tax=Ceratitis capitata TaxID=7213 RepID=A0A811V460_CERCA|nr:unnamed protein product [Ceratitis capitata]
MCTSVSVFFVLRSKCKLAIKCLYFYFLLSTCLGGSKYQANIRKKRYASEYKRTQIDLRSKATQQQQLQQKGPMCPGRAKKNMHARQTTRGFDVAHGSHVHIHAYKGHQRQIDRCGAHLASGSDNGNSDSLL